MAILAEDRFIHVASNKGALLSMKGFYSDKECRLDVLKTAPAPVMISSSSKKLGIEKGSSSKSFMLPLSSLSSKSILRTSGLRPKTMFLANIAVDDAEETSGKGN